MLEYAEYLPDLLEGLARQVIHRHVPVQEHGHLLPQLLPLDFAHLAVIHRSLTGERIVHRELLLELADLPLVLPDDNTRVLRLVHHSLGLQRHHPGREPARGHSLIRVFDVWPETRD